MYDQKQKDLIERVLSEPDFFPDVFKSWLVNYLTENVNLRLASYQLPPVNLPSALSFQNAWVDLGGAYSGGAYYKDPFGVVHLFGTITNPGAPAGGTNIAVLPYQPSGKLIFNANTNTGLGRVDVDGSGNLLYINGGVGYLSLSGIFFRAS